MINKRAKHYGLEKEYTGSTEFMKNLQQMMDKDWVADFDTEIFQLPPKTGKSAVTGVTQDSLKLLEMMATLQKDKKIGEKVQKKVK